MSTGTVSQNERRTRGPRRRSGRKQPLTLVLPSPVNRRSLPRLEPVQRKGPSLRPSPLAEVMHEDVLTLNLLSGCPHQCTFCFARAYPSYPGDERVLFYHDSATQLRAELGQRRTLPRAVYLCPSTDPFPPFSAVQEEACRVMEVLADFQIETWFMTRGFIRPFAVERLVRCRDRAKVTISLTTLDRHLSRTLEPLAAPPRMRIKQIGELLRRGIRTQVSVDPLIPGVTDTAENLEPLVAALGRTGVKHLVTGYLFLRQGIRDNLARDLEPKSCSDSISAAFAGGPILTMGNTAPAQHLPRSTRQRGYALLMALAAGQGMTVSVSGITNPDFQSSRPSPPRDRQRVLCY